MSDATVPACPLCSAERGFISQERSAQQGFTSLERCAQQGFTSLERSAQQGFTLIELLVALLIFALLSLAGVALLRGSVSAQGAVREHLDRLGDVQVAAAAIEADLAQATMRVTRTEAGTLAPAFFSRGAVRGGPVLQFVRGGWSVPDGAARPTVQKVEYRWRGDRLERIDHPWLDGAAPDPPATLIDGIAALALRFRDPGGAWRTDWTPTRPDLMPTLVEMTVTRQGRPPLTMRFLVGPGGPEMPPADDNTGGAANGAMNGAGTDG